MDDKFVIVMREDDGSEQRVKVSSFLRIQEAYQALLRLTPKGRKIVIDLVGDRSVNDRGDWD